MKTKDEIKKIITEHFGITSFEVYKEWLAKWRKGEYNPTPEDMALLHPDNVNCKDFWSVAEELFGSDCVCNAADGDPATLFDIVKGGRTNLDIARGSGNLIFIDRNRHYNARLLELGTGYGSFRNYVETTTGFEYVGFDVLPKISGVLPTTEDGFIPPEYVKDNASKFDIVFSSNVLQHLSLKQKTRFVEDAAVLLKERGLLLINVPVYYGQVSKRYMVMYGQFIDIEDQKTMGDLLGKNFYIVSTTIIHYNGSTGFNCVRR